MSNIWENLANAGPRGPAEASTPTRSAASIPRSRRPARLGRGIVMCLMLAATSALTGTGPDGLTSAQASVYVGKSFNNYLWSDQYIGNNGYRFIMQRDGNLVLYNAFPRACWSSGTYGNKGAYAKYSGDVVGGYGAPWLSLMSRYGGELRRWYGQYSTPGYPGAPSNVSLNSRGEVWIAYKKFVSC